LAAECGEIDALHPLPEGPWSRAVLDSTAAKALVHRARNRANQDVTAQRVGFITDDNHTIGCSPDRLVGDEGLLEIKAPLPQTQVEYWISGEVNERFRPQLQGQLYVSQRSWVDNRE
jgi:YqaJ-like viral recombinase domain